MTLEIEWRIAALRNGFRDATAYKLEFFFEFFGSAFVPAAIQWVLWYAMFHQGGLSSVAGMSYNEMIHYTIASLLFTQIRGGDHDFELAELIRNGQLSNYLLRPVGVVEFIFIRGIAPKLVIAGACLIVGMLIGSLIDLSPGRLLGAMTLALAGNIIHYQIGAALSTTSFLWEESYSILMVKNMVVSLLSGELIPLNLFPHSMQWIWKSTPFYLYVYGPVQYALGHWTHAQFAMQFGLAITWMLFAWLLIVITWRLGMRRYLGIGG